MSKESFGRYIAAINRGSQSILNKRLAEVDIGSGQHDFLFVISKNEGITQKELSQRLNIGKATTAKAVKSLMESGYVRREKGIEDKRFYQLYLTEKGKEIQPLINQTFEELRGIYSNGFTEEESEQTIDILNRILENMRAAMKEEE